MLTALTAILFVLLCINPAIAIQQWLGLMSINKESEKRIKVIQTINAVATIAMFVLAILME